MFNKWRILAQTSKKEKIEVEIFHFRKHLSVVENNLNFYKLKYDEVKKTSSEHIQRLLTDLSYWRAKALRDDDDDNDDELAIVPEKILIKWKIYFCNYFQRLIDLCYNRLDSIIATNRYYDPMLIIHTISQMESVTFTPMKSVKDLKTLSGEEVVLNWLNFKLSPVNVRRYCTILTHTCTLFYMHLI